MKRKITLVNDGKYAVSTIKITGNLYETAVFEVKELNVASGWFIPTTYSIDYDKEVARFNYFGRIRSWIYHRRIYKYWCLENIDLGEELEKYERIRRK